LKKAQAEGNKAEHKGNKAETKAPPSFRSTSIPGEAVVVKIIPKEFTMTTTKPWSAMKATIEKWGWPPDISPSDWLDKYLEITFETLSKAFSQKGT
jgi:hypothetical protein